MAVKDLVQHFRRFVTVSHSVLPGAIAAVISLGVWQLGGWQPLENLGYNALFQVRDTGFFPRPSWDKRVAVIAIDEASLEKYGRFPWRRDRYTQLLKAMKASRPEAIGFDILFTETSPQDARLAAEMSAIGNVVLARAWDENGKPLEPVPTLRDAAAGIGHILHKPDTDGASRRATLSVQQLPGLGLAMLQVYNTKTQLLGSSSKKSVSSQFLFSLPSEELRVWLNWPGDTKNALTYSFVDVVEGKVPKDAFANKFVLVGITATGFDPLVTPLNQNPPTKGVYLHAAVIDNLLLSRLLQPPLDLPFGKEGIGVLGVLLLLFLGTAGSWLLSVQGPRGRTVTLVVLPLCWASMALLLFTFYLWWIPIAAPIATMLLTGVGIQLIEQKEKQQLMRLFEQHVAPETAKLIWRNKNQIFDDGELKAQEMVATVLFMDIRGFTTTSEKLSPRELLVWLNQYLDAMTGCIMDNDGVVDKYIGDAIMAVFGIPFARTKEEEIKQDAQNAIAASLAMHERLQLLNQQLKAEGKPTIEFGIGIHTGLVVAGSVGSSRRLNYSVLGDAVNVAARLEAMNKDVKQDNPYRLLITSETYDYVSDRYDAIPVKTIQLRGRKQETTICAISGKK